jgi:hypothetical protein
MAVPNAACGAKYISGLMSKHWKYEQLRWILDTATGDVRWAQMLYRSEVIADAMF